jgi:hypothetical protein
MPIAILVGLIVAVGTVAAPVRSERASASGCATSSNDAGFDEAPLGCRNFVVELAPGERLSRAALLAAANEYVGFGFSENFLWYARDAMTTVNDSHATWSGCDTFPQGVCQSVHTDHNVLDFFSGAPSVTLSSFEHGGVAIFLGCGNWLTGVSIPTPAQIRGGPV